MKIVSFSVRNYPFTLILFLLALFLGLNALLNMPRGEDPPFQAPIFIVLAIYPGASPQDIEELVADPIEEALYELDDIKKVITDCEDGLLSMRVEFSYGVDIDARNNDVVREVNRLRNTLPKELAALNVVRASSSDVAILQVGLASETASYAELSAYAEKLKKLLENNIPDLKKVKREAFPEQQIEVLLDLERMSRYRIGVNQVIGALQSQNVNIPGGSIDLGSRRFNVKTNSRFQELADLQRAVVHSGADGKIVLLTDVADVILAEEVQRQKSSLDNRHAQGFEKHRAK
jgi:multidrug efflux pump subunit AcrB